MIIIAGNCVIESLDGSKKVACQLKWIEERINKNRDDKIKFYYKASYSKQNRTSLKSYMGPGLEKGLRILETIRDTFNIPVTTDFHEPSEAAPVGEVVSIIQCPAFLARQTQMHIEAAKTGKIVHVKKGQWMSPGEMQFVVEKLKESGCKQFYIGERGTFFGYGRIINDFAGMVDIRKFSPVIYDLSHSVQCKNPGDEKTGGRPELIEYLGKAACAIGIDGLFIEVAVDPKKALSDASIAYPLDDLENLLNKLLTVHDLTPKTIITDPHKYINYPMIDERGGF